MSNVRLLPTEKAIQRNVIKNLVHRTDYLNKPLLGRLKTVKELIEIVTRYVMEGYGLHVGSNGRIHAEKKPMGKSPAHKDKAPQRGARLNEKA